MCSPTSAFPSPASLPIASFLLTFGLLLAAAAESSEPSAPAAQAGPLVRNGDFEQADPADPTRPAGWDKPDGLGIQWVTAPIDFGRPAHGKAIRMNTAISEVAMNEQRRRLGLTQWLIPKPGNNPIAETYGLSFYSAPIPVKPGQAYRVTFDFKGASGGAKVWVRGWGQFNGERRQRYSTIVNCRTSGKDWTTLSQEFHPTQHRPEVTEMRVMLFAYYPGGIYWFDNVKIEPVGTPAQGPPKQSEERQPSETKPR